MEDNNYFSNRVANTISAMLAYWDKDQICRFANHAYLDWFGVRSEDMIDKMTLKKLLGPLYVKNLPFIEKAYQGKIQVFEREIPTPEGIVRHSIATYTPDMVNDEVRGIIVHVADVTYLKEIEREREEALRDREIALAKIKILSGFLPICSSCKKIRDDQGYWNDVAEYIREHSDAEISHGICPACAEKLYPQYYKKNTHGED